MKTYKLKFSIIFLFAIALVTSCQKDFLKQDPKTSLSTEQLFASLDNVQPFLNGLYTKFRNTRVNRKGFFLMLGTDECQQGEYQVRTDADQAGLDKYDGFLEPNNKPVAELWNIRWPIVVQASEAIANLQVKLASASKEDSAAIKSYIGQASFYRGAVLLELASYWGELPIPTVMGSDIVLSGRKSLSEVYQLIESDLNNASIMLSSKTGTDLRIPTSWAAKALLGKMYMSAPIESGYRDFAKAIIQFQDIYQKGGFFLASKFSDLWDPSKSAGKEAIFTFLFNNIWPDTNESQWYTGSRACSGNPTNYLGGYDLILPTSFCRTDASIGGLWEDGDLRKMESIRYDFVNGNMIPSVYAGFGEDQLAPHIKKYEDIRLNGIETFYNSGKNVYYLRYADILLSLAECLNEVGRTPEAVNIVNEQIRKRAWGGTLPDDKKWAGGMSQEEFRTKISDERMRELCFEGWRRFDLIRTNQFVQRILTYNRWANVSATISEKHKRYPIPIIEMKQNPNLTSESQNPGY